MTSHGHSRSSISASLENP